MLKGGVAVGVLRIDERACTGCGICVQVCPMDVFRLDDRDSKAFIKYFRDCQSCFLCEVECGEDAIYVSPYRERRLPMPW